MRYVLGIDFDYDTPKNRLLIDKIMSIHNGELDCITDKNGIFSFKDNQSRKDADYDLYKLGIISDKVSDS